MSAKPKAMGCYRYLPKYPELDNNTGLVFRAEKVSLSFFLNNEMLRAAHFCEIVLQYLYKPWE